MKCVYRLRPYEAVPGSVNAMHEKWKKVCQDFVSHGYPSRRRFNRLCREIIEDFDNHIKLLDVKKPRVGVVGEILVKFLPAANNYLVKLWIRRSRSGCSGSSGLPALLLLQPELQSRETGI